MTQRDRNYLKQEFKDGERPSGADFADLIDSFLNKTTDGLTVDADSNLGLSRGVKLGDSASTDAGTLRFNGGRVQFHNGTTWVDLATGSGGAFQPVGAGGAVAYASGNVGIGTFGSPPTYRLEVDLGDNSAESGRVRFGNAVCSSGSAPFQGYAYFNHRNHASNTNYALRQGPNGNVHLNAPNGQAISIRHDGTQVRLGVSTSGAVVVGGETNLANAGTALLQVAGEAFKNTPNHTWAIPSDARLKEDIRDLEVGLQQLLRVRPVRFRFNGKAGTPAGCEGVGIIGQEMEKIFPEMVQRVPHHHAGELDSNDLLVYNGSALIYVLVNAVKELANKVEKLEAALAEARKGQYDDGHYRELVPHA
jgi:hypothetical protein